MLLGNEPLTVNNRAPISPIELGSEMTSSFLLTLIYNNSHHNSQQIFQLQFYSHQFDYFSWVLTDKITHVEDKNLYNNSFVLVAMMNEMTVIDIDVFDSYTASHVCTKLIYLRGQKNYHHYHHMFLKMTQTSLTKISYKNNLRRGFIFLDRTNDKWCRVSRCFIT